MVFLDNRKKQKNRKIVIIVTVLLVVFSAVSLIIGRSGTGIEAMLRNSIAVVEYYVVKKPIDFVSDVFSEFASLKDVYEENAILKQKLDSYASVVANSDVLSNELKRLQDILDIEHLPTDYKVKKTSVISRPVVSWNSEIIIGAGSLGGVEKDMAVVSSKGMIGIVTSTTEVSATVSLLTSEKRANQIPVQIINGDQNVYGLLDKYDVATGTYEVTLLSDIDKLEENANVYTSGLGGDGKCPMGILIGTAKKISLKEDGTTSKLYVTPAADFNDLGYVAVVQRVNGDE